MQTVVYIMQHQKAILIVINRALMCHYHVANEKLSTPRALIAAAPADLPRAGPTTVCIIIAFEFIFIECEKCRMAEDKNIKQRKRR
jgi:hypothetical protein